MPQAVVTHDCVVGDYATIASGVLLGGGTRVGTGAYVGAGALIREGVSLGAWSQVGMGSVVLRDVGPGEVWVGNPARLLRVLDIPAGLPQDESDHPDHSAGAPSDAAADPHAGPEPEPSAARHPAAS
jgi:acetyltransferase-like isoleucine patch superfamily enzyme